MTAKLLKVDLHIHTCVSKDGSVHPADVIRIAKKKGLNRICITDHNSIEGALLAKKIDPEFVIIGEEILTETKTEILAFFVREYVPPHLSHQETVARLKEQGAIISVSHPFDRHRNQIWSKKWLEEILPHLDAIEGFNARTIHKVDNKRAMDFASAHNLPTTAGSDAHIGLEIGTAYLEIPPFNTADEFRISLQKATICGNLSPSWVHIFSTLNTLRWRLGLTNESANQRISESFFR